MVKEISAWIYASFRYTAVWKWLSMKTKMSRKGNIKLTLKVKKKKI